MNDTIQKIADEMLAAANGPTHIGAVQLTAGFLKEWATRLTALSARASAGEGGEWVMVPRKMTTAMWKAWEQSNQVSGSYQEDYDAMLAAAPQPAQAGAGGGGDAAELVAAAEGLLEEDSVWDDDLEEEVSESAKARNNHVRAYQRLKSAVARFTTPASPATGEDPCIECGADTGEACYPNCCTAPQPAAAQRWPSSEPGYTTLFNAIAAATSNYAGIGVNVSVSKFLDALAAAPQPQAVDCGEAGHEEGRCGNAQCMASATTPEAQEARDGLEELRALMSEVVSDREDALVSFFRTTGSAMGRYGDAMGWTPEQTARHFLAIGEKR